MIGAWVARWPLVVMALAACQGGGCRADPRGDGLSGAGDADGEPTDPGPASCQAAFAEPFVWPVATHTVSITPSSTWKHTIAFDDPFIVTPPLEAANQTRWVKFTILIDDPNQVYFQDSKLFPFHAEFATAHLDPFLGLSVDAFDALSLHAAGQRAILGALLLPPLGADAPHEVGIELLRHDAYHPEMVRQLFELVKAALLGSPAPTALYVPTYEQSTTARCFVDFFAANNVPLATADRWIAGDDCYAPGWALGRFHFVTAAQINAAYLDGTLSPGDILVTDGVPAEVPFVAGLVSTAPSTPNSHVAILAASYGVPFVYARLATTVVALNAVLERQGVLRSEVDLGGKCRVRIVPVDPDAGLEAEILALKVPPQLVFPAKATCPELSTDAATLVPADTGCYGGKASHYGLLRTAVPDNSQAALAFSFQLWDAFLAQVQPDGRVLGAAIQAELAGLTYPPDHAALTTHLSTVRQMIKDTDFTVELRAAVIDALTGFEPGRKIRFRSSTNVEDTDTFVGAGLYDSFSGCLADNLDGDELGPSICDANEPSERGVLRAIKRVYASFYNDNAFLERLRHRVDESAVGMAVLAHYSFPDAEELANGVAVVGVTSFSLDHRVVSQAGAVSVTNPSIAASPERVRTYQTAVSISPTIEDYSSLLPIGETVLSWNSEYLELATLMQSVASQLVAVTGAPYPFTLDFEFKKTASGLVLKQVRELPQPSTTPSVQTYLLNSPVELCVVQGETTELGALGVHEVKLRWMVTSRDTKLDDAGLTSSLFAATHLYYNAGTSVAELAGRPADWAGASFAHPSAIETVDSFSVGASAEARTYRVTTTFTRLVPESASPILFLAELQYRLDVGYAAPRPRYSVAGGETTTLSDSARLAPCPDSGPLLPGSIFRDMTTSAGGVSILTRFWNPPDPGGVAGYTAPLDRWDRTTLTGLSSDPIELVGEYSQTYAATHHNFKEYFIFEPGLEPGLPTATADELLLGDVWRVLWEHTIDGADTVWLEGLDGHFRTL